MHMIQKIIDKMTQYYLIVFVAIVVGFNILLLLLDSVEVLEILIAVGVLFAGLIVSTKVKQKRTFIIALFAISFLIRFVYAMVIAVPPISDFALMYRAATEMSQGNLDLMQNPYFTTWAYQIGFVTYQSWIIKLFGETIVALKVLNVLYIAGTTTLVYLIGEKVFGEKVGRYAGILHLMYLPLFYYAPVLTNQHIATFFFYFALYFIVRQKELNFINAIFAGIFICLGNVFRPFGIIFVLSLVLFVVYQFKSMGKREKLAYLSVIASFYLLFALISQMFVVTGLSETGLSNENPYWKFVVGLGQPFNGRYNLEDQELVYTEEPLDQIIAHEKEIIKDRLFINPISMAKFQVIKLGSMWGDFENPVFGLHHLQNSKFVLYYKWHTFEEIFDHFKRMEKVNYTIVFIGLFGFAI
ncbi:MAG: glycosyltransferase family 39 protein, partial [Vallitaleaceae bacterium]|nr:glycosyltransferase family 39 protein [Vallitaleaceae bacterium]